MLPLRIITIVFIFFLSSQVLLAQDWQELKGQHFIIYFVQDKDFADEILRKAERDYERIATDLGYIRYSNFWTWANRVNIYLYPDRASYLKASGQPEWSEGMADYTNKMILGYSGSKDFLISVLPHEMAHLVFRDFIGFNGEVPLWLDEGVAQWEEENKRFMAKSIVRENLRNRTFLSLNDMMNLDVRLIKHADKLHLHTSLISGKPSFIIIDGKTLIELYYLQSTSLVGFLIEQYGTNSFTDFCRQLRDGKSLEDALRSAYSNYLNNLDELENRWVEYLQKE